MSGQQHATSSMIFLVVIIATAVGLFTYTMARHSLGRYDSFNRRVATPIPARSPEL
jgi:hypothetical protein